MKRLLLIVLFISFGYSQSINDEKLIEKGRLKYHPDTKELYSGKVFKNRMDGEKDFEGSYKDGEKDGLWTDWYENGQKKSERNYKYGFDIGSWTSWYENGQKKSEGNYKREPGEWWRKENSWRDGLWTDWWDNGQKRSEKYYEKNYKIGSETAWYKNGQKKSEVKYKDGQKEISSKMWEEDGSVYDPTLSDEMREAILQLVMDIKPHIQESAYDEIMEYIESGKINKKNFKRHYSKWSKIKKKHSNKK